MTAIPDTEKNDPSSSLCRTLPCRKRRLLSSSESAASLFSLRLLADKIVLFSSPGNCGITEKPLASNQAQRHLKQILPLCHRYETA